MPDVYKLIYRNKDLIKYNRYILSPSCFGVWACIYSINTKHGTNIRCEIRDAAEPEISQNYNFKFCSLIIKQKSKIVHSETDTQNAKDIYIYMDKLYDTKQR
jgi:hypothetical protein